MSAIERRDAEPELEHRTFAIEGLRIETRGEGDAKKDVIVGHAAVFGQTSEDMGGWREQIAPGAFTTAIKTDDVRALFNHDPNFVLGRNRSGTLRLTEDFTGLAFEIDGPFSPTIRDLVLSPLERRDISQMSFAFICRPNGQDWSQAADGTTLRTLLDVGLADISIVTYAAYSQTDVALRSLTAFRASQTPEQPTPIELLRAIERNAEL